MYNYPQYIYPPTTVPVQRYFANPHVRTNKYWGGGLANFAKSTVNKASNGLGWGSIKDMTDIGGIKGLSGGVVGGLAQGVGGLVGGGAKKLFSNGLDSGLGNGIGSVGKTVGGFVGNFNPILGAAFTAGSGVLSGIVNGAIGKHTDQALETAGVGLMNERNNNRIAESEDALRAAAENNYMAAIDNPYRSGWANRGWAKDKNATFQQGLASAQNMNTRNMQNIEYNMAVGALDDLNRSYFPYGGFLDNPFNHPGSSAIAYNLEQQNLQNQKQMISQMQAQNIQQPGFSTQFGCGGKIPYCIGGRLMAQGGPTNPHGSDFSNGLTYIEAGGTHEENPYQGVPMGVDQQGTPNVVEQDEVIVPKKMLDGQSDYVLSNRIPVTPEFAEKYHLPEGISIAQAAKKLTAESRENPNDIILEQTNARLMQEMVQMQEQIKAEQQQQQMMAQQQAMQQLPPEAQEAVMQQAADQQIPMDQEQIQEVPQEDMSAVQPGMAFGGRLFADGGYRDDWYERLTGRRKQDGSDSIEYTENPNKPDRGTYTGSSSTSSNPSYDTDMWQPLDTRMRMAPIWMSGIATLMDQLGLTNTPDYAGARSLERIANQSRGFMPVSYRPIGERMSYNPFDPYQRMIAQNALAAANQRAIQDNSNGNGAMANAALVAQNRNNAIASGQLDLEGRQYNDNLYNTMLNFNGNIDAQNSQGFLSADTQNAYNWRLGQNTYSSLVAEALELRQKEKAAADAARALNLSNFVKGLSKYGKENMYFNMVMGNPTAGGYWFGKDGKWHYTAPPKSDTGLSDQRPSIATNPFVYPGLTRPANPYAAMQARLSIMPDSNQYSFLNWNQPWFFNYPR